MSIAAAPAIKSQSVFFRIHDIMVLPQFSLFIATKLTEKTCIQIDTGSGKNRARYHIMSRVKLWGGKAK
ncbi:hypothetical protein HMPREF0454_04903 [Hafnia alvei ATCC 51873]|uniref:Uncharacterized protein n=1 Tax=Hafnia alvei ATCC 51873 TaxID=1002364 RepID=G9YE53_HAFAL|nr:hypothetical protein HMPREF0454_04903 [Hafnia alvei ATCC 51873]